MNMINCKKIITKAIAIIFAVSTIFAAIPLNTMAAAPTITLSNTAVSVYKGETTSITLTVNNYTKSDFDVEYTMSNPGIVSISKTDKNTSACTLTLQISTITTGATGVVVYLTNNLSTYATFTVCCTEKPIVKEETKKDSDDENTKEEIKISSDYYMFDDGYVTKINRCTSIDTFKKNILSNATDIYFIDSNNNNVTDANELVKTGMKVKFKNKDEEKTYTIIVRGDLDGDGEITIVDFSKILLHISEKKGFELTGNAYKGADMNNDGDVNIVDFSKLLSIFASI